MDNFVAFILTHGRPDNVITYKSLRNHGYTGKIIIVIDDEDKTLNQYYENFDDVEMFSKKEVAKTFDEADNFNDRRAIVYARNACFDIAKRRGFNYFIQLDDDYSRFEYRVYTTDKQKPSVIKSLDNVFGALLDFYKKTRFDAIAIAQGGDFIGGKNNKMAKKPTIYRKAMNSFICSTDREFKFQGRINEDVNTYTSEASKGLLLGTVPLVSLVQKTTQSNKGGMTDIYLDNGTYVKSFYTVIFAPSCCIIKPMGDTRLRLHHSIDWERAVPKIVRENTKRHEQNRTT